MKKLSLFLTLSLLTIIGTSTLVKANPDIETNAEPNRETFKENQESAMEEEAQTNEEANLGETSETKTQAAEEGAQHATDAE